ncbi:endopeptidase La [Mycoplasma sp. (ex Biomphalaria glabrata)]|uniref:endopeptidase La n=1 Tax=Mycoplasma sp. (ex Biomphalaria glabrata) TaxID=1749074 RepID=UPI000A12051D|nr:endopeptidase La [Mycoplasma sp. (ex Biomphalaria glabrata)]
MTKNPNKLLTLPLLAMRNLIVFPGHRVYTEIARKMSINACNIAQNDYEARIVALSQKNSQVETPTASDFYNYGTLCNVRIKKAYPDGTISVELEGVERFKVTNIIEAADLCYVEGEMIYSVIGDEKEELALMRQLQKTFQKILENLQPNPSAQKVVNDFQKGVEPGEAADFIAQNMAELKFNVKQQILEALNVNERLQLLINEIEKEREIVNLEQNIQQKVKSKFDESQREYILREKLKAIKEELGDITGKEDDASKMHERLANNPYPEEAAKKIKEELVRYEMTPPSSSEGNIIHTYLEWLLDLPWWQKTTDNNDLSKAETILNEHHYGLEKAKERIIEHLAVQQKTNKQSGPIICFVGPPGVGKTSLGKSISEALERKFVRVALGGVKDESEIRGHRRTYIGSMPGRIIQGMKKAETINPVFLLDEVDKLSNDFRGDPSSALLEVLDPEQNKFFSDNYLEINYDLSNVMFIATANYLQNIPEALMDRMEIIELSSYTEIEKEKIAHEHLIPKIYKTNNITEEELTIANDVPLEIIKYYTKEAGVRQLERLLSKIVRKAVVQLLKKPGKKVKVTLENLTDFLGNQIYDYSKKESKEHVGVVVGLAWTQYGGDILPIEATYYGGKGNLVLTGKLGDVMKESANIALSFIKANKYLFGVQDFDFSAHDIHIHCPEGAVPKDGPSAGITLTTAMVSLLSKTKVSQDIAMTGEITLRGNVLAIGGLKEKLISAKRSKIKKVLIPAENKKSLIDVPKEILDSLEIVLVSHYRDVFREVFGKNIDAETFELREQGILKKIEQEKKLMESKQINASLQV